MEEWSNNASLGYTIMALNKLGYNHQKIQEIVNAIRNTFDFKSIDEAKEEYCKSPF